MADETVRRPMESAEGHHDVSARLRVIFPSPLRTTIPLHDGSLVIGRAPEEGVIVDDATMSRQHIEVVRDGDHCTVRELGSTNGTRVNGTKLEPAAGPALIRDGSVVRTGDVLIVLELGDDVDAQEPPGVNREAIPGTAATAVALRSAVAAAGPDPSPVLLVGETGTGKEYVARELHRISARAGPFVGINCASISPQLVESQLFGHAKGAFTGAHAPHDGLFRAADGGTLFLDEIGELPLSLQPKLLRALQEGEVHPVGEARTVPVDVRFISATNKPLADLAERGAFRLDLYARLSPWEIAVPALRRRRADLFDWINLLADDWYSQRGREPQSLPTLDANRAERLVLHGWPDNLRGLDRMVHRVCGNPKPRAWELPAGRQPIAEEAAPPQVEPTPSKRKRIREAPPPQHELERVLAAHNGSVRATAKHFGRDRRQIYRWMDLYGLRKDD